MSHDPSEYTEPTNAERAERIPAALLAHQRGMGAGPKQARAELDQDPESAAADLLTDLRHWCDVRGLDFEDIARRGQNNHYEERRDERAKSTSATGAKVRRP